MIVGDHTDGSVIIGHDLFVVPKIVGVDLEELSLTGNDSDCASAQTSKTVDWEDFTRVHVHVEGRALDLSVRLTQVAQQSYGNLVLARDLRNILGVVQTIGEVRGSYVEVTNSGCFGPFKDDLVLIFLVVDDEIILVLGLDRKVGDLARGGF